MIFLKWNIENKHFANSLNSRYLSLGIIINSNMKVLNWLLMLYNTCVMCNWYITHYLRLKLFSTYILFLNLKICVHSYTGISYMYNIVYIYIVIPILIWISSSTYVVTIFHRFSFLFDWLNYFNKFLWECAFQMCRMK